MTVTDNAGRALPWDRAASGRLGARGPAAAPGYVRDEDGHPDAVRDEDGHPDARGFLDTGGAAAVDAGRISSIEVENLGMEHPDAAKAAVLAARHPERDGRPLPPEREASPHAAVLCLLEGKPAKCWPPDDVVAVEEPPHAPTRTVNSLTLGRAPGGGGEVGGDERRA